MRDHNDEAGWITPAQAAEDMSRRAGYEITIDDIRQLKRTGKIKKILKLNERITLYNLEELRAMEPLRKRKPKPLNGGEKERG